MASAALMVAGVISTGGLTALAAKLRHSKRNLAKRNPGNNSSEQQIQSEEPNERSSNHGNGIKQD
jgi:hypothetical protein